MPSLKIADLGQKLESILIIICFEKHSKETKNVSMKLKRKGMHPVMKKQVFICLNQIVKGNYRSP